MRRRCSGIIESMSHSGTIVVGGRRKRAPLPVPSGTVKLRPIWSCARDPPDLHSLRAKNNCLRVIAPSAERRVNPVHSRHVDVDEDDSWVVVPPT